MGFLNKSVYEPLVDFRGIDEWSEDLGDDFKMEAAVHAEEPPMVTEDRNAQAFLPPLVAAKLLWNSKSAREMTEPMMELLGDASDFILKGPEEAAAFTFQDAVDWELDAYLRQADEDELADVGEDVVFAHLMRRGIPILTDGTAPSGDQSFRAELIVKRQGAVWAKVHAPVHGPALFAAYGLFAFIEQWAHEADYEQTTVPSMVALAGLCDLYFIVLEGEGWEPMRMLTQFNDLIGSLAAAEDPRGEYAEFVATILPENTSV